MVNGNLKNFPKASVIQSSDLVHISQGGVDKGIQADVLLQGLELGLPNNLTVKDESSTTRLLLGADKQSYITCLNVSTTTLTLSTEVAAGWNLGDQIYIRKGGSGDVVITPDSGVTINTNVTLTEAGQIGFLIYKGTDTWDFVSLVSSGGGGGGTDVTNVTESTTTRTLGLSDHKKFIDCTNAAGCVITVPPQSSVAWLSGTEVVGAGRLDSCTFIDTGVDIIIPDDRILECTKGSPWALRRLGTDVWILTGYLVEA